MTDADALARTRRTLRRVLSLPGFVLRMMAGGKPVRGMGRTLDPAFQLIAHNARGAPRPSALTPEQMRAGARQGFSTLAADPAPEVDWEPLRVPAPHGDLPARLYRPRTQDAGAPLMLWMHQGGGVIGDLETSHSWCTRLAATTGGPVVSLDYRLAPEHRHPAAFDDALSAYLWARDHAGDFGAPPGRAAIGGDSMGGYLAAGTAQALRAAGEAQPALQLLVYPAVEANSATRSMTEMADAYPLTAETLAWFMSHYAPDADPSDVRLSPLRQDLAGLAPAIVVVAGFDPLTDQGEAYAEKLKAAGVPTVFRRYDALPHAFLSFGLVPAADRAAREIAALVRDAYRGAAGP